MVTDYVESVNTRSVLLFQSQPPVTVATDCVESVNTRSELLFQSQPPVTIATDYIESVNTRNTGSVSIFQSQPPVTMATYNVESTSTRGVSLFQSQPPVTMTADYVESASTRSVSLFQVPLEDLKDASKSLVEALLIREKYMALAMQTFPNRVSRYLQDVVQKPHFNGGHDDIEHAARQTIAGKYGGIFA